MKGFMLFVRITAGIILLLTIITGSATTVHYALLAGDVASIAINFIKEKV